MGSKLELARTIRRFNNEHSARKCHIELKKIYPNWRFLVFDEDDIDSGPEISKYRRKAIVKNNRLAHTHNVHLETLNSYLLLLGTIQENVQKLKEILSHDISNHSRLLKRYERAVKTNKRLWEQDKKRIGFLKRILKADNHKFLKSY
jgi:hypothetical protein